MRIIINNIPEGKEEEALAMLSRWIFRNGGFDKTKGAISNKESGLTIHNSRRTKDSVTFDVSEVQP
jgi:hypothetical protein